VSAGETQQVEQADINREGKQTDNAELAELRYQSAGDIAPPLLQPLNQRLLH